VAEVNIEIETQQCPDALVRIAGKHFKRWDKESMRFISNIRDEYPED
jgi:F-box protein 21